MTIIKKHLDSDEYRQDTTKKTQIYLHHTAGGHRADWTIGTWNKDTRGDIATAYVVSGISSTDGDASHDGEIYQAFPDEKWAFHLGVKGTNGRLDKASIGIEICNYGYLYKGKDGRFYNYVNKPIPNDQVAMLTEPFRGHLYYHKYTDKQIESVRQLLQHLSTKHGINLKLGLQTLLNQMSDTAAFEYQPQALKGAPGVWTHTNVRSDKSDCSPQTNLVNMIKGLV